MGSWRTSLLDEGRHDAESPPSNFFQLLKMHFHSEGIDLGMWRGVSLSSPGIVADPRL